MYELLMFGCFVGAMLDCCSVACAEIFLCEGASGT